MEDEHRGDLLGSTQFNRLRGGEIAYRQGQHCHAYVMCMEGQTRVFKTSRIRARDPALSGGPRRDLRAHHLLPHGRQRLPGREHGRNRRAACRTAGYAFHRLMGASPRFRKFVLDNYGDCCRASSCSSMRWRSRASISGSRGDCRRSRRARRGGQDPSTTRARSRQRARGDQPLSRRMGAHGLGACVARLDRGEKPFGARGLWRGRLLGNKARGTDLGQQRDLGYIRTIATALNSQQNCKNPQNVQGNQTDDKLPQPSAFRLASSRRGHCRCDVAGRCPACRRRGRRLPRARQRRRAPVKGEFDDQCTMGLASGQTVKTDCSVNWTDTDGDVYCFSSRLLEGGVPQGPCRQHPEGERFLGVEASRQGRGRKGIHRGGRQQAGRGGDRRALQGRRLRVSRSEARCRPQPDL